MRRMERRMYRRGQAMTRRTLLVMMALVIVAGLVTRLQYRNALTAEPLIEPTAPPLTGQYDETVQTREVTLPEGRWYAIQTGIFSTQEAAQRKALAYTDRGAPGYVVQDGEKWRVLIACYRDKTDASAVRTRLADSQNVETYLHEWLCPQLRLKLSGMAGQLDVVEAGLTLHAQAAAVLRDTAEAMDSGQILSDEVVAEVTGEAEQVQLWARTARERFARPYPALVNALLTWTEQWSDIQASVRKAAAESPTALSAALKLQAMALYEQHIQLRNTLHSQS